MRRMKNLGGPQPQLSLHQNNNSQMDRYDNGFIVFQEEQSLSGNNASVCDKPDNMINLTSMSDHSGERTNISAYLKEHHNKPSIKARVDTEDTGEVSLISKTPEEEKVEKTEENAVNPSFTFN